MLGYLPDRKTMSSFEPGEREEEYRAFASPGARYKQCRNYAHQNVCNWMVSIEEASPSCIACRLNDTIPSLDHPNHRVYWANIEASKRRLVYSLLELGLPVQNKEENPKGLAFAFLASAPATPNGERQEVLTDHNDGLITINIAEADEIERELTRRNMHEAYRTLLGHFRHESGHYYWDLLVDGSPMLDLFRNLFGDEREDYDKALQHHYAVGAPPDWSTRLVSSYASSHPWEDWAETWAHYLHLTDTLETAKAFGVAPRDEDGGLMARQLSEMIDGAAVSPSFAAMLGDWVRLSLALNAMNRSMGMRDPYPFVLNRALASKLALVHNVVLSAAGQASA
jgi:hypothetical protein